MMHVYKRPPNKLLSIARLKSHLLHEVESNKSIMTHWEAARTALRNLGYHASIASWVSLKNDPLVFTDDAEEKYGFIFVNDEDDRVFVVTSWLVEEYGPPLNTY
ncbi:hypothetical protein ACWKYK_00420 [Enterobacter hormaechei]